MLLFWLTNNWSIINITSTSANTRYHYVMKSCLSITSLIILLAFHQIITHQIITDPTNTDRLLSVNLKYLHKKTDFWGQLSLAVIGCGETKQSTSATVFFHWYHYWHKPQLTVVHGINMRNNGWYLSKHSLDGVLFHHKYSLILLFITL